MGVNLWIQMISIINVIQILPIQDILEDFIFCVEATKGHGGTLRSSVLHCQRTSICVQIKFVKY